MLRIAAHPLLVARAFETTFPRPLGELSSPPALCARLALERARSEGDMDAAEPEARSEQLRKAVRDLLRHGGYKPTGRGKPSSEYLERAAGEGLLASISLAVDACNATSLASGFPISVVDLERTVPPFHVGVAEPGTSYVFNPSGQEIDVSGLLCLFDQEGPCANAVKDSQRTKTHAGTLRTLSLIWGVRGFEDALERALVWYGSILEGAGASIRATPSSPTPG